MIGILPNRQMHVGLNVSSTTSWKQEVMPSLPHLFRTDETKNVVSKHESWSVASPSAEKMLGYSLGILEKKRWCLLTEKGQSDIVTHQTNIWNKVSTMPKGFFPTLTMLFSLITILQPEPGQTLFGMIKYLCINGEKWNNRRESGVNRAIYGGT
jgi:hypothetical protein